MVEALYYVPGETMKRTVEDLRYAEYLRSLETVQTITEKKDLILETIGELSSSDPVAADVLYQRFIEDRSAVEVGSRLHYSPDNIYRIQARGIKKLSFLK